MILIKQLENVLTDDLKSFRLLQILIAAVCILIPLLLQIFDQDVYYPNHPYKINILRADAVAMSLKPDSAKNTSLLSRDCGVANVTYKAKKICKDQFGFRMSVSDYANSSKSYLFGMLYCMAAMLYLYNGAVYMKRDKSLNIQQSGHWYNLVIGAFLLGIIFFPANLNATFHNLFSVLFFIANVIVMFFVPRKAEKLRFKLLRKSMAIATLTALLGALPKIELYSLLWAEWISFFLIATYLIMMAGTTHYLGLKDLVNKD